MMSNIIALTLNDLAIAFKNKTFFLIFFIPFFVFFSLKLVDISGHELKKMDIGIVENEAYDHVIIEKITSVDKVFNVISVASADEGRLLLKEKKIDGLLLSSEKEQNSLVLVVLKKESLLTIAMVESFAALQRAAEGNRANWIFEVNSLQKEGVEKQTLPTWILMLVLLVSFIILPGQVAEEKEKKLLLALLQTPMREIEWLIAKLFLGMILIIVAVLFLHLLGNFDFGNVSSYLAFIVVGSFCFSSYGILLGFLCRNQASARTLGVIFYLPHLLPSALSDFSEKLTVVAPLFPSYQFYQPVKSILLDCGGISNLYFEWVYLLLIGLITFFLSYLLIKKRWLM